MRNNRYVILNKDFEKAYKSAPATTAHSPALLHEHLRICVLSHVLTLVHRRVLLPACVRRNNIKRSDTEFDFYN